MAQRILITGGAGKVATSLRPRLVAEGRTLRLFDVVRPSDLDATRPEGLGGTGPEGLGGTGPEGLGGTGPEEVVLASLADHDAVLAACEGVDAIVHLGGQSKEADAGEVLRANALGTYNLLEAARKHGITRVMIASSTHAAGFHVRDDARYPDGLPADLPPRPDTLYGWSKASIEALARLYVDRFGLDIICVRVGLWFPVPPANRGLATWLSPDDGARLVEACLSAPSPGFRLVWGVSRNTRRWWSLAEGEAIGYYPKDDAEIFAAERIAELGEPDFRNDPELNRVGGWWCDWPLSQRMG